MIVQWNVQMSIFNCTYAIAFSLICTTAKQNCGNVCMNFIGANLMGGGEKGI